MDSVLEFRDSVCFSELHRLEFASTVPCTKIFPKLSASHRKFFWMRNSTQKNFSRKRKNFGKISVQGSVYRFPKFYNRIQVTRARYSIPKGIGSRLSQLIILAEMDFLLINFLSMFSTNCAKRNIVFSEKIIFKIPHNPLPKTHILSKKGNCESQFVISCHFCQIWTTLNKGPLS